MGHYTLVLAAPLASLDVADGEQGGVGTSGNGAAYFFSETCIYFRQIVYFLEQ